MKPTVPDDAALLAALRSAARPMHISEVATHLGLPLSSRRRLSDALAALVERGLAHEMPGARYRLPKQAGAALEGRFTQHPRGFGFVTANDGGADVFVPNTAILGAMHGDLVAVTATDGHRGREGVVTEVLKRRPATVPGALRVRPKGSWVEPDDARIRSPITLREAPQARDGDAVIVEVTQWPEHPGETPEGRVIEVLGDSGELSVEVRKVLVREGVEEGFHDDALAAAAALPEAILDADREGREDLTGLDLVTIDPDDARDHDDAVLVRPLPDDMGWSVIVAIADVSHYVTPGSALDAAAMERGTSIYLPDRAIPMLPRELSSKLASLVEGEDRLVLGVEATVAPHGELLTTRLFEGVMRSRARLTYGQVAQALGWSEAGDRPATPVAPELMPALTAAAECATRLRSRRMHRGALDFDLPEGRVRFGDDGRTPVDVVQSRKDPGVHRAYSVIEELMLLANEAVAQVMVERDVPTIFRVHGEPDAEALERFCGVARAYGHRLDPEDAKKPKKLSAFLRRVQASPEARVLGTLLLRAMQQARYSANNVGHFGLASKAYLHFTSPIRRYPDIVVHRATRALVRKQDPSRSDEARAANARAAAEVSRLERRAMDVEREVLDLYRCVVAQPRVGELHTARVSGFSAQGVYLDIEAPFLTGLLRLEVLGQDQWALDELGISLASERTGRRFTLGDEVAVEIVEVSLPKRAIYLGLPLEDREAWAGKWRRKKTGTLPKKKGRGAPKHPRRGGRR